MIDLFTNVQVALPPPPSRLYFPVKTVLPGVSPLRTDDALARAVEWESPLVLAAPCCHHDVAAQLRRAPTPAPYSLLTRHGILRERFADTLTDAVRAGVLRLVGYRVDVIEFVESRHTPRNTLLRAVRTGAPASERVRAEYHDLTRTWGVHPALADRLHDRLA